MASESITLSLGVSFLLADHLRVDRDCYCAPAVLLGLTVDLMGTCSVACHDADNVSCGGATTPIVYSINVGGIFPELSARLALGLPQYDCEGQSKSSCRGRCWSGDTDSRL